MVAGLIIMEQGVEGEAMQTEGVAVMGVVAVAMAMGGADNITIRVDIIPEATMGEAVVVAPGVGTRHIMATQMDNLPEPQATHLHDYHDPSVVYSENYGVEMMKAF